jgi:ribonucleoside-diphosphate reductase alpha chain
VSNTITVKPDEWDATVDYIYDNREFFTGVSLLSASGDLDYAQAPFQAVMTDEELGDKYGQEIVCLARPIVEAGRTVFDNNNLYKGCTALVYPTGSETDSQRDWLQTARQFSDAHFDGKLEDAVYCLKNVEGHMIWEHLVKNFKTVDWTQLTESKDKTRNDEISSCSNGSCELTRL